MNIIYNQAKWIDGKGAWQFPPKEPLPFGPHKHDLGLQVEWVYSVFIDPHQYTGCRVSKDPFNNATAPVPKAIFFFVCWQLVLVLMDIPGAPSFSICTIICSNLLLSFKKKGFILLCLMRCLRCKSKIPAAFPVSRWIKGVKCTVEVLNKDAVRGILLDVMMGW